VAIAAMPFQFGLAAFNSRKNWFTAGEIRFWGIVIFLGVELLYLGLS
jgi:hypothetical protein